jgi:hypothetical protein
MDFFPIHLHEDFVENARSVLRSTNTPREPSCPVCDQPYGRAYGSPVTTLAMFNELPENPHRIYLPDVVEPVVTPCGHTFCMVCICAWLMGLEIPRCPMCREYIEPLEQETEEEDNNDGDDVTIHGLCISLHISIETAQEILATLRLSIRQLLTTKTPMPFVWLDPAMISNLPKVMVTIARRFHYNESRAAVPPDLSFMRLHDPLRAITVQDDADIRSLEQYYRSDAPLVEHPDARQLYVLLCELIEGRHHRFADAGDRLYADWHTQTKEVVETVREKMPDASGGIGRERWWAYVHCVVKALLVWQANCQRIAVLVDPVEDLEPEPEPEPEGEEDETDEEMEEENEEVEEEVEDEEDEEMEDVMDEETDD